MSTYNRSKIILCVFISSVCFCLRALGQKSMVKGQSSYIRINTKAISNSVATIGGFYCDKPSIYLGDSITLFWSVLNFKGNIRLESSENQIEYSLVEGNLQSSGKKILKPTKSTFYRLIAEDLLKTVKIEVKDTNPIIKEVISTTIENVSPIKNIIIDEFKANKRNIQKGEKVTISWKVRNTVSVSLEIGDSVEKAIFYKDYLSESFEIVSPSKTTTYVIRVGDIFKSLVIEVGQ